MAVVLRKSQSASSSATDRLEAATGALADVNRRISEAVEKRNQCLLKDDDQEAIRLGAEIDALHQAAKAHEDKIRLLRAAAEQEAAERRAREREGLIVRIEDKLAARDAVGRELQDAVAAADKAFRKLIDIGAEVTAVWPWPASDIPAILLSSAAIAHALSAELYRIGGRPRMGGGQIEPHGVHAGVDFPGAKVPRFELTHLPEKIVPFTAVLREATAHASNIMRGKRPSVEDASMSTPASSVNGMSLTTAQERLAGLLKRQAELAEDPARESEYFDAVAAVAVAQAELDAEQRVGAQQHG
jgi:hypothetical protein